MKQVIRCVLVVVLVVPITACVASSSDEVRVLRELQRMNVDEYFESQAQIDLARATERGSTEGVSRAIGQGGDVNKIGKQGMTPLFWALAKQNLEGFRLLLEYGANPHVVVELPDGFHAASSGAVEMASKLQDSRYLRALLEHGADPNMIVNEENHQTPLYLAIMHRRLDNIKVLLEFEAEINYQDKSLQTPLMRATSARMYEIALFLLRAGADPAIEDRWGGGPADIIKQFGDRGIDKRTNDLAAYEEFVNELKERGLFE